MKNKRFLCLAMALPLMAHAWDFTSGGFYYDIASDSEVAVAPALDGTESVYEGVQLIPEQVYFDGKNYTVAAIADRAFSHSRVTQVQIPNTVTTIGQEAFAGCDLLSSITLPLYLDHIPPRMLAGTAITCVAIPEGVTLLGDGAFHECTQLHTVFLPASLLTVGEDAFEDCFNLFEIYCAAPEPPKVLGDRNFLAVGGIDLIVPDGKASKAYQSSDVWGNSDTFSMWTNDDINLDRPSLETEVMEGGWTRVQLGGNMAFNVYDPFGYLMALTAADHFYFTTPEVETQCAIAATNLITESEDVLACNLAPAVTGISDMMAEKWHPTIIAEGGAIYISGDNNGTWTSVYDGNGRLYYQHPTLECFIDGLPTGRVYIVIVGNYVQKVRL
ncbi:MAG: leucine-rich repeat domain-containing protein [Muribaculaceae bacterium]|nr:leucine-rich repeat domain-containing protein [Muribaculaceae bacterium]